MASLLTAPRSLASSVFAKPPTSAVGSALQSALRTSFVASPAPTSSFFTKAPPLLPNASSVVRGWSPATPATVPPAPPAAASSSVGGVFATIARMSQPSLPPSALQFARTQAPVTGFNATPVSAGWRPASFPAGAPSQLVGYPPSPPSSPSGGAAASLPPALPPAGQAATISPQVSPTSTLPDSGTYPQGGFDPGSSSDGSYLTTAAPTPAPAPSSPDFGTIALYGGGALVGLFLLSKMFKGGGGGEASA
jgi:hypothetical protein